MSIKVIQPGLLSSIQDFGRTGYAQYGVPQSGVMDRYAAKIANLLVGNTQYEAVMETTLMGPTLQFQEEMLVALVGLEAVVTLNDEKLALLKPFEVKNGDVLQLKQITKGTRLYLAVKGGFLTEKKLESRSMYEPVTSSGLLRKDDELKVAEYKGEKEKAFAHIKFEAEKYESSQLEVFPGPEFHRLPEELKGELLTKKFSISKNNSRMAYQLEEKLENELPSILTQPVLPGTVQFTPGGNLIILMRDAQTTGGYPRIFQLTEESINLLAQKKQGDAIEFQLKQYEK
ncbi:MULTISPECIES: 5-oxoprolinase subunit C family protein [Mesonia]|uniref:KipI antagonist n=1 Tax=Mesonia oceanica TaxID=2687242 RepID=A0AC61YCZ4_9FLAO|nr:MULTISPECIES: biotin-dependent carboxyltransferase family protein [Mesonia]MAN27093.1 allophanate hydrolase [Mesonia sp.]MAQ41980.1 allophanate hydrolase [Mesonia sp.]MBJ97665.1 allophanate hydrolase [Flavobacteriaceae bacterium]VVV02080.1 KipI antagonist [Mesonia oceanica]|tara:strand:+ start:7660 stop:8520 length:861 start_codon:yes stop_codon:yes gene_type:complete